MNFRNISNYVPLAKEQERGGGVIMTVPDDSLSMRDILDKFSKGMDPSVSRDVTYDGDANFDSPDLEKLRDSDLVDREEYASELAVSNAATKKSLDETIAKQKAATEAAKLAADKKQKRLDDIIAKEDARSKDDK